MIGLVDVVRSKRNASDNDLVAGGNELVDALFLASTNPDSSIEFARWNPLTAQWARSASPVPLGPESLTVQAPALGSFIFLTPNKECRRAEVVGTTGEKRPHHVHEHGIPTVCP